MCVILFNSCLGSKKLSEASEETKSEIVENTSRDSVNVKEISKEINDELSLSLRTNNKVVDSIVANRLKGLNLNKTSGGNSYQAKFDYEGMALILKAVVGETQNQSVQVESESEKETTMETRIDNYIKEKITAMPWYLWAGIILLFLPNLIKIVMTIVNPVMGLVQVVKNAQK